MKSIRERLFPRGARCLLLMLLGGILLGTSLGVVAQTAGAGGQQQKLPFNTPLKYALQLPSYCHGQYFGRTEPQYQLPPRSLCGVRTNHFCPGLGNLYEARDTQDRGRKQRLYNRAAGRFRDTLRNLEEYPNCPMRPEVESALMQAELEMQLFR